MSLIDKITIVTDLGPGDGGKGSIINALVNREKPSVIIKRGGAQGSHGVRKSDGRIFNFSQWGCGTFEKVPTYLSSQMVIMPVGLDNEAKALKKVGISDPWMLLSCSPNALVATPYHKIASQIEELLLRDNPRGTIGSGVGQAVRLDQKEPELSIYASTLKNRFQVKQKLEKQADYYRNIYRHLDSFGVLPNDADLLQENLNLLYDEDYLPFICDLFAGVAKNLYLEELRLALDRPGTAIVECSHGVLTDAETGFKPHVSALRTLPEFPEKMLRSAGYTGEIKHLAVHRAYEYRHGAGPMPTYDPEFTAKLPEAAHKAENRWQGKIRAGKLDRDLLFHAIKVCEPNVKFDGLAVTWFDQLLLPDMSNYLSNTLNVLLQLREELPLKTVSLGPTEKDKIFL